MEFNMYPSWPDGAAPTHCSTHLAVASANPATDGFSHLQSAEQHRLRSSHSDIANRQRPPSRQRRLRKKFMRVDFSLMPSAPAVMESTLSPALCRIFATRQSRCTNSSKKSF